MEEIRKQLEEAEVIGGILDDFHPLTKFYPIYGEKQINLGDVLSPDDVHRTPQHFDFDNHDNDPTLQEIIDNSTFVLVMTEPDPDNPSIQYLHWLLTDFIAKERSDEIGQTGQNLIAYEPPRPMDYCMMVFALFKQNASQSITRPIVRENFSTRDFANTNGLGPPLCASFFYIQNDHLNSDIESSTGSTGS